MILHGLIGLYGNYIRLLPSDAFHQQVNICAALKTNKRVHERDMLYVTLLSFTGNTKVPVHCQAMIKSETLGNAIKFLL